MATALLVMDLQHNILARIAQPEPLLNTIKTTIEAARKAGIPVIYCTVQFREGFPEINDRNKLFSGVKSMPAYADASATAIHPIVAPQPGDVHVIKRRFSAFTGSDLEVNLRAKNIDHIVLCGVSTSGVVLSTCREAADKDYKITILEDCCNDADEEVHRVLTQKVFPKQADVLSHIDWIKSLS